MSEKEFFAVIEEFLNIKDYAPTTEDRYRRILTRFLNYKNKRICDIKTDDVLNWLEDKYKNVKPRTRNHQISVISSFFKFCTRKGYANQIPLKKSWRPKNPRLLPNYLNRDDLAKIKIEAEKLPIRDRLIVKVLNTSGIRRSELVRINKNDIDIDKRRIKINGKGNKKRTVFFTPECRILFEQYLPSLPADNNAVFISKNDKRLSDKAIYRITTKLGKEIGLSKTLGTHKFRHTFATRLKWKGADLITIAKLMGHVDLNTTRIYAGIFTEEEIYQYDKCMR